MSAPLPWYQHPTDVSAVVGADELAVATVFEPDDAAQIVRCVNAHDELVAALEQSISDAEEAAARARMALARATS